jgi:hypothetical protein
VTTPKHTSVLGACRLMQEVSSVTEAPRNPCRQGCTPMKAAHPFSYTPVQLHTHKAAHSFSCTPVAKVLHCSCQNVTRLTALIVNPNWQKFFFRKREKAKAFSFSIKRNLYRFSCSIQYLSSVVKSNITGVYISTLS